MQQLSSRTLTRTFILFKSRIDVARRAAPGGPLVVPRAAGRQPRVADQRRRPPLQLEVRLRPHGRGGHGQGGRGVAQRRATASLCARQPHSVSTNW